MAQGGSTSPNIAWMVQHLSTSFSSPEHWANSSQSAGPTFVRLSALACLSFCLIWLKQAPEGKQSAHARASPTSSQLSMV